MIKTILIASLILFSVPLVAQDTQLADPAKEEIARELMKELRCLQCQNQSIDDSNADIAVTLRQIVREQIAAGSNPEEVKEYLVARYGDWVLLEPPVKPMTYFLWGSPALILLLALYVLFTRRKTTAAAPLSESEKAELDKILGGDR